MQYPHMLCSYASIVPYAASRECHHINFVAQLQSYRRITLNLELKPARCISKSEQLAPVPPREVEVMFLLLSTSSAHSAPGGGNRSVWQLQRRLLWGIRQKGCWTAAECLSGLHSLANRPSRRSCVAIKSNAYTCRGAQWTSCAWCLDNRRLI